MDPPLSTAQQYIAHEMDALGYCHLLAVGSVDGLVEASRQSRVCAGAANQVACTIFRCVTDCQSLVAPQELLGALFACLLGALTACPWLL